MRISANHFLVRIALCLAVAVSCPSCVNRALQAQQQQAAEQAAEQAQIEAQQEETQRQAQADRDRRDLAANLAKERANCSKRHKQNPDVVGACAEYAVDKDIATHCPDPDMDHSAYLACREKLEDRADLDAFRRACSKSSSQTTDLCIAYAAEKLVVASCPDPDVDPSAHESCGRNLVTSAELVMACKNHHDQSACIDIRNRIDTAKRQQEEVGKAQAQIQEQSAQIQEQAVLEQEAQAGALWSQGHEQAHEQAVQQAMQNSDHPTPMWFSPSPQPSTTTTTCVPLPYSGGQVSC